MDNGVGLSGDVAEFDVADVIQLIGRAQKTGKLVIFGGRNPVTIFFKEGHAVFASPAHQRDFLGDLLQRRGFVTREDVEAALAVQRQLRGGGYNIRVGSILAARGAIPRKTIEKVVRIQIEETVAAALSEDSGRFEFHITPEFDEDVLVSIDSEWVLLESLRQIDEFGKVAQKAPHPDAVFAINPKPESVSPTANLGIDEWCLVSLVNGIRTVEEIVNRSGLSRLQALHAISRLAETGFIVARPTPPPP